MADACQEVSTHKQTRFHEMYVQRHNNVRWVSCFSYGCCKIVNDKHWCAYVKEIALSIEHWRSNAFSDKYKLYGQLWAAQYSFNREIELHLSKLHRIVLITEQYMAYIHPLVSRKLRLFVSLAHIATAQSKSVCHSLRYTLGKLENGY